MKITNKTRWRTADLLPFFRRVAKDELDPAHTKRLRVTVSYTRGGPHRSYSSGWAYYKSATMTVRVSAHKIDKVDFAHVIAHEMAHCRGLHHGKDMNCPRYKRMPGMRELYAWADELPIREKAKRARPKGAASDELKLAAARAKVAEWDRKIKASTTRRKGWARKIAYYERKLAIAAKRPPAPPAPPREPKPRVTMRARIESDPRVESFRSDDWLDGHWLDLKPGFAHDDVHTIHEYKLRDVLARLAEVEPCECEDCSAARRPPEGES